MGYTMHQLGSDFRIPAANKPAALAAIKALAGKAPNRHYMWVNRDEWFTQAATLEAALKVWRWTAGVNDAGDVVDLTFEGGKLGDEEILFTAIARYVTAGSYLEFFGEDHEHWRWSFDGQRLIEQHPTITWA